MPLLCSYYSVKFSIKVKATSFADAVTKKDNKKRFHLAQFPNDLNSFLIFGNFHYLWQLYSFLFKTDMFLLYWFYIYIVSQTLSKQNLGLFTNRSFLSGTHLLSLFLNLTCTKDKRSLVPVTLPARYHSGIPGL